MKGSGPSRSFDEEASPSLRERQKGAPAEKRQSWRASQDAGRQRAKGEPGASISSKRLKPLRSQA
jgi:hypothetical protein